LPLIRSIAPIFGATKGPGPEVWQRNEEVSVKISSCKTGGFDNFSLKNTVGLVLRVLKADVLWIVFEKKTARPVIETKNAFDVLRKAQAVKVLPKKTGVNICPKTPKWRN
jgi:hypothetical protein